MGNYHLLNKDSIGFCGSREASEKGLQAAYGRIAWLGGDLLKNKGAPASAP